jgi:Flp pilus assembly protein CpaB
LTRCVEEVEVHLLPRIRLLVARRPWIYWLAIVTVAGIAGLATARALAAVASARQSWGEQSTVWVATADIAAGQPIHAESRRVPRAVVPTNAVATLPAHPVARQHLGTGEMITSADVSAAGVAGLLPDGWVALAVPSAVAHFSVGDHVNIYSGDQLVSNGSVVDTSETEVMVAVPADAAPAMAMGLHADVVTLGLTADP